MSYKGFLGCHSKVSKEDQEFYDLKNKAAEYYRSNGVPEKIEGVLNEMFFQKPNDIYGYLVGHVHTLMLLKALMLSLCLIELINLTILHNFVLIRSDPSLHHLHQLHTNMLAFNK